MEPPSPERSSTSAWPPALALLSAGVTAAQLALMQVLSCMQWHHFAYLVVSVAMLGFGASGTVLSLGRERLLAHAPSLVPWLMLGAGAGFAVVPALLQIEFLRFDLYLLFVESDQWLRLTATCVLLAIPFFCAGLATGLILTAAVEHAGRLYAANLIGAGAGALGGLALLELFAPARLPALTALLPLAGAMLLSAGPRSRRRKEADQSGHASEPPRDLGAYTETRRPVTWTRLITLGCAVFAAALAWRTPPPAMSPFKDLARTLDLPGAQIVLSRPSAQGWLQLVDAPALRGAPPAGLAFSGHVPHQLAVFLDGNRYGSILDDTTNDALAIFGAGPESLPWRLGSPQRVLLLHEGAGGEAGFAHVQGAASIALVEPHREFAAVMRERLSPIATLQVRTQEPRLALAQAATRYDLIRFPTVGTFGGSVGLRAVGEEYLLTREAIAAAWRALAEDGTLLVTVWMDHPERAPLRLLATLVAGLSDSGVPDPRTHLAAVRGWASVTFLLRRAALGEADVAAIRGFCRDHGFDPLLLPGGLQSDERERHHVWDNPQFFARIDAIAARSEDASPTAHDLFRLDAPTDERPYFSQFLRARALRALEREQGLQGVPFFELGSIVVAVTAAVLFVLATTLIVVPLAKTGWQRGGRGWTLAYFAALGAGFMLLEIVLLLRLTPFAGGAIPAAAIVIATLLVGAGIGSRWSQEWVARRGIMVRITSGAAAGIALLGFATNILPIGWDAPWLARMVVCALLIAPVALVLGMAFPTGLRHLAARAPTHVPWAWAINNCVSVITPSLATLAALQWGHLAVFACAVAAYAAATLATLFVLSPEAHRPSRA